jgi:hypothetical protein
MKALCLAHECVREKIRDTNTGTVTYFYRGPSPDEV